ncbi:MAG: S-adenosylmethionine:tRNA ribosyltransferase-isomerase, partial [Candidatus Eremiobacteraeota bacterium]|nr:S-adenosylmethionine:tRNA ribosyltransferase-isomerase [Candidatus Eremiobacteraeota bacterium]
MIAQEHARPRDSSRLLVVDGDSLEHRVFRELPAILRPGDVLVLNDTRVIAARIIGHRFPSGGKVEVLLLRPAAAPEYNPQATRWLALVKPARKAHPRDRIDFDRFGYAICVAVREDGLRELE